METDTGFKCWSDPLSTGRSANGVGSQQVVVSVTWAVKESGIFFLWRGQDFELRFRIAGDVTATVDCIGACASSGSQQVCTEIVEFMLSLFKRSGCRAVAKARGKRVHCFLFISVTSHTNA